MKNALLLSGGMDSIAIAYWKRPELGITIDYGQLPAPAEVRAASAVCAHLQIPHYVIHADLQSLGSGDLAGGTPACIAPVPEWWPYRNQMLVTLAAMYAAPRGYQKILIGTLATDNFHADGTKQFIHSLSALLALQEGNMQLEAPAIELSATELIKVSNVPEDLLAWAHSCHKSEFACGNCRGCFKHYKTLQDLGYAPY
jgi:7-cyano-7-deazaguanine synthase